MNLYEIIVKSAEAALKFQDDSGSMPPGHNGPYYDLETPVRNTSHWAITFLKAHSISGDDAFEVAAYKCMEYLLRKDARPMGATFWHRKNPEKDFANGLVGQAWTMESLLELGRHFKEKKSISLALEVFLLHPYDTKRGAWKIVNVDGSHHLIDITFNHQLWFAAVGSSLCKQTKSNDVHEIIEDYVNKLHSSLILYPDGLIRHDSAGYSTLSTYKQVKKILIKKLRGDRGAYIRMKSVGYHSFNLYAFGILKSFLPNHTFWKSKKIKKVIEYARGKKYEKDLENSKYGFPYNPAGFEIGFAFQELTEISKEIVSKWASWQIKKCYNFTTNLMTEGGTQDKNTSAARIYEATRINDIKLNI